MKIEAREIILQGLDERNPALQAVKASAQKPARGWLRAVREAVALSQGQVAQKLAMTRQSYAGFEAAEERRAISLGSLERAAEAMGCEVVYFLLPRPGTAASFAELKRRHDPDHHHQLASKRAGDRPPAQRHGLNDLV